MLRISICFAAAFALTASVATVSAQTPGPAPQAAPAKSKMTRAQMRANWSKNKPKLADCRKQVKAKGLIEETRWTFMQECMDKT